MTNTTRKSRRGVYYDLSLSPYVVNTPYGDTFRFSSQKKMEIYTRDVDKELKRVDDLFNRFDLGKRMPDVVDMVKRAVTRAFYTCVER